MRSESSRRGSSITVVLGATLLGACVSQPDYEGTTDSRQAFADDIVCTEEVIVGSRVPQTRCTTRAQRAKERENSQRWMAGDPNGSVSVVN